MSDISAAMSYLGVADIVQASGTEATFIDAAWAGCSDALANVVYYYALTLATCGPTVALVVGEVPTAGLDTPAAVGAGAACVDELRNYIQACYALGQCLGSVDANRA